MLFSIDFCDFNFGTKFEFVSFKSFCLGFFISLILAHFQVTVELFVNCAIADVQLSTTVRCAELAIRYRNRTRVSIGDNVIVSYWNISVNSVELWWPNGYGKQKLYTIQASIDDLPSGWDLFTEFIYFDLCNSSGHSKYSPPIDIGFRHIRLVQDLIDRRRPEKGRTFYFEINGLPIFLKGLSTFNYHTHHFIFQVQTGYHQVHFHHKSMTMILTFYLIQWSKQIWMRFEYGAVVYTKRIDSIDWPIDEAYLFG